MTEIIDVKDLLDPVYIIYAPQTFILKFCIGLITGLIAHKVGKISTSTDTKHVFKWTVIEAVITDMALRPALKKANLFLTIGKKED